MFDRKTYFDSVRASLFGGKLSDEQVRGQEFKLARWEQFPLSNDLRHLAYPLATAMHETGKRMYPCEEIGRGAGRAYGKIDPETKVGYWGRGDLQITHRYNYQRATDELALTGPDDLVWHPERALDPTISAAILYLGMRDGWFRKKKLSDFFSAEKNDAYNARDIINADKRRTPGWSKGVSIGMLVKKYHEHFLTALQASYRAEPVAGDVTHTFKLTVTVPADGEPTVDVVKET